MDRCRERYRAERRCYGCHLIAPSVRGVTPYCDACREANNQFRMRRYQARKRLGICPQCCRNRPDPERVFCDDCLLAFTIWNGRRRAARRRAVAQEAA